MAFSFKFKRSDAIAALAKAKALVGGRTFALPILSHAKLSAGDGKVEVEAMDGDNSLATAFPADGVTGTGSAALPAAQLFCIVKDLPAEDAAIEVGDDFAAVLTAGRSRYRIPGMNTDEWPVWSAPEVSEVWRIPQDGLKSALRQAMVAAQALNVGNGMLSGVHVVAEGDVATFVATDSRRMCRVSRDIGNGPKDELKATIGLEALKALLAMLGDEGEAEVRLEEKRALFRLERDGTADTYSCKLLEGMYPNWKQVFPKDAGPAARLDRVAMGKAVKRTWAAVLEQDAGVTFDLAPDALTVTAKSETGEASETVAAEWTGKGVHVKLNPKFMLEALREATSERVSFAAKGPAAPCVLESGDDAMTYVVMPIRED